MKAKVSCELCPNEEGVSTMYLVFEAPYHSPSGVEGVFINEECGDWVSISTLDDETFTFADEVSGKTATFTERELTALVCEAMKSQYGWSWTGPVMFVAKVMYKHKV